MLWQFVYLGNAIREDCKCHEEVKHQITIGKEAFIGNIINAAHTKSYKNLLGSSPYRYARCLANRLNAKRCKISQKIYSQTRGGGRTTPPFQIRHCCRWYCDCCHLCSGLVLSNICHKWEKIPLITHNWYQSHSLEYSILLGHAKLYIKNCVPGMYVLSVIRFKMTRNLNCTDFLQLNLQVLVLVFSTFFSLVSPGSPSYCTIEV